MWTTARRKGAEVHRVVHIGGQLRRPELTCIDVLVARDHHHVTYLLGEQRSGVPFPGYPSI